jgi:hypothetical protein
MQIATEMKTHKYNYILFCVFILFVNIFFYYGGRVGALDVWNLREELRDGALYDAVSRRVKRGDDYYDAAMDELIRRGYPTGSVFNWRLPAYSSLPDGRCGRLLLALVALASSAAAISIAWERPVWWTRLAVCLTQANSLAWLMHPEPTLFMEIWSGHFMLISIYLYYRGFRGLGVLAAALSLWFRELAAPYLLLLALLAGAGKRYRESVIILSILLIFIIFYLKHCGHIFERGCGLGRSDLGWIDFGGPAFIGSTFKCLYGLNFAPTRLLAICVPLSVLGLTYLRDRKASLLKATALTYVMTFAVMGRSFNFYWGWMYSPIMQLGLALSPAALWEIIGPKTEGRSGDRGGVAHEDGGTT